MIQRYTVNGKCVDKDDNGFYVHYTDHLAELAEKTKECDERSTNEWNLLKSVNSLEAENTNLNKEVKRLKEKV